MRSYYDINMAEFNLNAPTITWYQHPQALRSLSFKHFKARSLLYQQPSVTTANSTFYAPGVFMESGGWGCMYLCVLYGSQCLQFTPLKGL